MTLRTPRRRISPRTKKRYRAIKNFFRRALGTSTQGENLTNSTYEVSVTDLKNKIEYIEDQLDRVSKHCQDVATLEETFRKESANLANRENIEVDFSKKDRKSKRNLKNVESNLSYQSLRERHHRRDETINGVNVRSQNNENDMNSGEPTFSKNVIDGHSTAKIRRNRKPHEIETFHKKHNIRSKNDIVPSCSTSSFRSLSDGNHRHYVNPDLSDYRQKQSRRKEHFEHHVPEAYKERGIVIRDASHKDAKYERHKSRKYKRESGLDENFIADIIEKQYKPVKLFGKRHSDFSQFSAPVCRDQEFRIREEIQEGSELCSCCYDDRGQRHRYVRNNDLSDMRSICDTRLYSSKERRGCKSSRRHVDDYNNSALYDVVPVKEKSSPKSRRKFADDNKISYFKEVPPSPNSQRPRLNLKVHNYAEYENSVIDVRQKGRKKLPSYENYNQTVDICDRDVLKAMQRGQEGSSIKVNIQKSAQIQEDGDTLNNSQVPNFQLNVSNNDTTLNTQTTDSNVDKADKTLGEIKNILQSFLIELKKESTHDDNSNITSKIENKTVTENQEGHKINANTVPNSRYNMSPNIGQCGTMPPSFLPTFPSFPTSPCCYPIIPLCPMNCFQSGYMLPNPSFTCTACAKNSKENICHEKANCKSNNTSEMKTNNETQELIKEIYKFVSQNPKSPRKLDDSFDKIKTNGNESGNSGRNLLTNRSVGSTKAFKHDANVGTPNMKCFSKSCEAIGSKRPSEDCYTTNASYSDTVLEKLSLEATQSSTESDVSSDVPTKKGKQNRFKKVLRSLRLLRKKKDVIEELSESESTIEVKVKSKPPFKQHITNYAVHGHEYFSPPPIPQQNSYPPNPHDHSYGYDHRCARNISPHPMKHGAHNCNRQHYEPVIPSHHNPANYFPPPQQMCPNYDPHYNQLQPPQVPLCLKEIEVKSIGTQSVRKMSIFRKFTKKIQSPQQDASQQYNSAPPVQTKPTLWKSLQEKAKQQSTDPMAYSLKTQKQLAQGDMKLRSAMLKKLFYKRNPFSPRNLIVRTLLGKDKSSFGDPPKMYKPRMFL